jgi:hypothetical protein
VLETYRTPGHPPYVRPICVRRLLGPD